MYLYLKAIYLIEEGACIMEEIIKRVVSIDKKASDILKQTEEYLDFKEKDIRNKIEAMRNEATEKTKAETKSLYESTIQEAEEEAGRIRQNTKDECNNLSAKFLKIKEKLESRLFSRIFN